jgi:hypothetical protein
MLSALLGCLALYGAYDYGCRATETRIAADSNAHLASAEQYGMQLQARLDTKLNTNHTAVKVVIQKVPYVVNHYIPAPGAATTERPAYLLTAGAVRLWNGCLSGACPSAGLTEAPAEPGDLNLTSIDFARTEQNALLNFGQYTDCRVIVQGWQEWYKKVSSKH